MDTNFNLQDDKLDLWNMPLGLKLTKSLLYKRLAAMDMTEKVTQKPKASNFPFTSISIGGWQMVSTREGDLTAKLYFAKRKLVWEFLDGELKTKIEVHWDGITAINAYMPPNQPGTLQIELGRTPSFFREINPQPLKHTNWEPTSDFTAAHALHHRIHSVTFPQGVLDEHYSKLLQYDKNLFELSQMPFPTQGESPYFNVQLEAFSQQSLPSPSLMNPAAGMTNHLNMEASFPNSSARGSGYVLPRHEASLFLDSSANSSGQQMGSLMSYMPAEEEPFLWKQFNQNPNHLYSSGVALAAHDHPSTSNNLYSSGVALAAHDHPSTSNNNNDPSTSNNNDDIAVAPSNWVQNLTLEESNISGAPPELFTDGVNIQRFPFNQY